MSYTPMIEQYLEIKKQHIDSILFFRLGDFYEMFFDDAITASEELEITLTGRDAGKPERVPMCGIPYHAAETYIARLIEKGYKVAICEQVENPSEAKGIVKREVVRVITPGTILENVSLDEKNHNFLASVYHYDNSYGLAFSDISTGLFECTQFPDHDQAKLLIDELSRINPAELIIPHSMLSFEPIHQIIENLKISKTILEDKYFTLEKSTEKMNAVLGNEWQGELQNYNEAIAASGALLWYLELTQMKDAGQIKQIKPYFSTQYMLIDRASRKNLELTSSLKDGDRWGTLLWVLDRTKTAMGGRTIRNWIDLPVTDAEKINQRLDGVEELKNNIIIRHDLTKILNMIYDLERLSSKTVYGTANARDLKALGNSLGVLPSLKNATSIFQSEILKHASDDIDPLDDICTILQKSIIDEPPLTIREGRLIRDGYNPDVDRLRKVQSEGKAWLAGLENEERENSGIKNLKVGYNRIFGYYFEVTKSYLNQVPDYFIRKQTLANAERYITPKLKELEDMILTASDRLVQLEYSIFNEIREKAAAAVKRIQQTSAAISLIDVLLSLAEAAVEENYNRPRISSDKEIIIKEGRHPVVEKVIGSGEFVPNDTIINQENKIILLTGPNMAGKSTYMRQVALLVLMAQIGSFIPAQEAQIGIVDKIFTRIGAADDLAGGLSTFMVEMIECKNIITGATPRSLVVMDEVGRGTSTYDGISIARALIEYIINNLNCRTMFSTHYHELTDLDSLPGIKNYTVSVQEKDNNIIFLRKVIPGKADRSYGIHVAALAGLPDDIVNQAQKFLLTLEHNNKYSEDTGDPVQGSLFTEAADKAENKLSDEISKIDISTTTPLEALNILAKLQVILNDQ